MGELGLVLAPLLLLALLSLLINYVPLSYLVVASLALVALGSVVGLPCGVWYHVVLRRELLQRGDLPKGWLWQPTHQHRLLDAAARARVQRWFALGGAGFVLIVVGALLGVLALAVWYRAGGAG